MSWIRLIGCSVAPSGDSRPPLSVLCERASKVGSHWTAPTARPIALAATTHHSELRRQPMHDLHDGIVSQPSRETYFRVMTRNAAKLDSASSEYQTNCGQPKSNCEP